MIALRHFRVLVLLLGVSLGIHSPLALSEAHPPTPETGDRAAPVSGGQRDFDFEIGTWKTHLKRLQHPLTGSRTWVE